MSHAIANFNSTDNGKRKINDSNNKVNLIKKDGKDRITIISPNLW